MKSAYSIFIAFIWSFLLVGCGGGGSISNDPDGGGTPEPTDVISIALAISNTEITAATPATITATVTSSLNGPVNNTLVTFTLNDETIGAFDPVTGTALTNSDGIATIELATLNIKGAGTVSATVEGLEGNPPTVGFNMEGDGGDAENGNLLSLSLTDGSGTEINTISQDQPGTIKATYTNASNEPIINEVITFTASLGKLAPESGTALTNESGVASIAITAGDVEGAANITATVGDLSQSLGFTTKGDEVTSKPIDAYELTLTVVDSANAELREISHLVPGQVVATLTKDGQNTAFEKITFDVAGEGNLNPSSGSALTNANGDATVNLITGAIAGAGTVTASFTLEQDTISTEYNYSVVGDAPGGDGEENALSISLINSITGSVTSSISSAEPGRVNVTLTDKDGAPISGKVISFSSTLGAFLPSNGTALTDAIGKASIILSAGSIEGAGEVTAVYGDVQSKVGFQTAGDEIDPVEASPEIDFNIYDCSNAVGWDKALKNFEVCTVTDNITNDNPGIIGATVTRSGSTQPLQQILVSAATTLGAISPASGTAITNASGKAVLDLYANGDVGAGEVSLKVQEITSTKAFEIGRVDISLTISTEVGSNTIPAGGSTIVEVTVFNPDGSLSTGQPFQLEFTSECVAANSAFIDTPVVTTAGKGFATYRAAGCEGTDAITVTAVTGGSSVTASTNVNVDSVSVGAIQYLAATPKIIALRGTGGIAGAGSRSETSVVSFKLLDESNQAAPNELVCFELSTDVGGMTLTPSPLAADYAKCSNMPQVGDPEYPADITLPNKYAVGYTNAAGEVAVTVHAGDIPTAVKVFALWSDSTSSGHNAVISNTSDELAVTTGIADNDSFSLSTSISNPEGWNYDNEIVTVNVLAADHFNNLVPAGTTITYRTEGGGIDASCSTGVKDNGEPNGACSVEWRSQDPRPFETTAVVCPNGGYSDGSVSSTVPPCMGNDYALFVDGTNSILPEPRPGRATITALAIGEESFVDLNGNGLFDDGEYFLDLSEAFTDHNEDGRYRNKPRFVGDTELGSEPAGSVNEEFIDYNRDQVFNEGDDKYTGLLCASGAEASCTDTGTGNFQAQLNVFRNNTIVMSGSVPYLRLVNINKATNAISQVAPIDLITNNTETVYLFASDLNNNTLPYGTTITAGTDNGELTGTTTYEVGSNTAMRPAVYSFSVSREATPNQKSTGTLVITVKTPKGEPVSVAVTVNDAG
ncbi:beta strand repeat-containing protein [Shewanella fidelis]|uniref:beta strand repeat-containing protein n=1 Tax=Shewanella fidelis TaxID=173509 RepID=UPI00048DA7AE|nr:invasin [Shewanella fidelis]